MLCRQQNCHCARVWATIKLEMDEWIMDCNIKLQGSEVNSEMSNQSEEFEQQLSTKAKYSKTSMKKKEQLIHFVLNQHYSIYRASKKLKISNSTAKSILNNYQKYGIILQRNTKTQLGKIQKEQPKVNETVILKKATTQKALTAEESEKNRVQIQIQPVMNSMELMQFNYPFFGFNFPYFYSQI